MNFTNNTPIGHGGSIDYSSYLYVMLFLFGISLVLVFTLNSLCLIVLRRVTNFQTTTKIFLALMTVNDLVGGVQVLFEITISPINVAFCHVLVVVKLSVFQISAYSLLLLTIDRYLAIAWCIHYPRLMTDRRAIILVVTGWLFLTTLCSAAEVIYTLQNPALCSLQIASTELEILLLALPVLDVICIFVMYIHILMIARRQARRIAQENQPNGPQRISTKSLTTLLIITLTLLLGLTSSASRVAFFFFRFFVSADLRYILDISFKLLFCTNSWMNVMVYYWRNQEFREELKRVVSVGFQKLKRCKFQEG